MQHGLQDTASGQIETQYRRGNGGARRSETESPAPLLSTRIDPTDKPSSFRYSRRFQPVEASHSADRFRLGAVFIASRARTSPDPLVLGLFATEAWPGRHPPTQSLHHGYEAIKPNEDSPRRSSSRDHLQPTRMLPVHLTLATVRIPFDGVPVCSPIPEGAGLHQLFDSGDRSKR